MLKVYGIVGQTTAIIKFPVNRGRAHLECEFKHGHIGGGQADRPATYSTRSVVEQHIIESSPYYGGMITLLRTADEDEPAAPVAVAPKKTIVDTPAVPVAVDHPEITTVADAKAFLKANKAKATNLVDEAHMRSYMSKIGVTFSNLSW